MGAMVPFALIALYAALGFIVVASRTTGKPSPTAGAGLLLLPQTSGNVQSLSAHEKVALFGNLAGRALIDRGKLGTSDVMVFKDLAFIKKGDKYAPAIDLIYGANMGIGVSQPMAILVSKVGSGETSVLAAGPDWFEKAEHGSMWSVFLAPGEAETVAKAVGISVRPRRASIPPQPAHTGAQPGYGAASVVTIPVDSSAELGSLLPASIGFVSGEAEDRATKPAGSLPNELAALRDTYAKANALYVQNDVAQAKEFAPLLAPTVDPLRNAGYALASSQIQTLLAKVGAP